MIDLARIPGSPSSTELEAALRLTERTIAPEGALPPVAARIVDVLRDAFVPDASRAGSPDAVDAAPASIVRSPWLRLQLVRALVVAALADGAPTRALAARVEAVAEALDVREPGVTDLRLFAEGKRLRLRLHLLRRFWVVDRVKARIRERGFFRSVVPTLVATFFRRYEDPALASRFRALSTLPADTLGRAFLDYLRVNGFSLPGERGAVSDIIVQHDLAHVLGGYGTTPGEEVLVTGFSAGHRIRDPFGYLLFGMFQFHLGLRLTPGAQPERGFFDPPRVLAALRRGAAMNVDLTGEWDYWPWMSRPLAAVREALGVPSPSPSPSGSPRPSEYAMPSAK